MLKRLLDWAAVQKDSPEEGAANRTWLQAMIWTILVITVLYVALLWKPNQSAESAVFLAVLGMALVFLLMMLRRGHHRLVAILFSLVGLVGMLFATYAFGGVQSGSYLSVTVALVIVAMFLRGRITALATIAAIVFGGLLVWGEAQGWYTPIHYETTSYDAWRQAATIFIIIATLVGFASQKVRELFMRGEHEIQQHRETGRALQEQTRYLAALHETTLSIINRLELQPLLESLLQSALELTETEHGYIDMYFPEQHGFVTTATQGIFVQWTTQFIDGERGLTKQVFKTGQTVVVPDYPTWSERIPFYSSGFHAIAAAPMKMRGEILGIIGLVYTEPGRKFSQKQISALEQLAELAALAVDNTRLYQSVQEELQERQRVQDALAESEENLRLALGAAQMGIWNWNIETDEVAWSDSAYELFGLEKRPELLTLRNYMDFIPVRDRNEIDERIRQSLENPQQFFSIEHPLVVAGGTPRWILSQGRVYTNEQGKPIRMSGLMSDITERKTSEEALREAHHQLEANAQMLERRSRLLQIAAEVSRATSAILDLDELSQQTVDLVLQHFGLYYVGLFLVDEKKKNLILHAATGEAGREMLQAKHQFAIGNSSMVGWCVANQQARIALDVGEDAVHFSNPLLPKTRSELALPLISRGQMLGAMTIQSENEAAFSEENLETFQILSDQLANAILNAYLYDQLEQELEERKRAEAQVRRLNRDLEQRVEHRTLDLKASEEKFRALADNNPLRIRRYDREGRFLYANQVIENFDFKPEQVIGKTIREVVRDPDVIELAERSIREVFETGKPFNTEYKIGDYYASWWLAPEFDPSGKVVSVITTTLDITERHRMDEELRSRTLELQASNRELESFSYSVSHDLRAPLRALDGFSRILLDDFRASLPEDAQKYLGRIREAAQQMSQLIDDMLRLSRITRAEMRQDQVDLTAIANRIFETLHSHEPEREVQVNVQEGLVATGDDGLLRMVMENMISNAWKFSAKTYAAQIEIGKANIQGQETFFIRDNGVGFDMTYADKLFAVFQRLHGLQEFPGTGVGLAIVQRVIHRHGGRIWAESEPNRGATFYFTLAAENHSRE